VNAASTPKKVTLANTGDAALNITSIVASAGYAQTNTCGASLAVGGNCEINITFKPTAAGDLAGTVTITTNAASSPDKVALSGKGVVAPAKAEISQADIDALKNGFNGRPVGSSTTVKLTLKNTGGAPLPIGANDLKSPGPEFVVTHDCGAQLAAGASCTITVTFKPTTSANHQFSLNAGGIAVQLGNNAGPVVINNAPVIDARPIPTLSELTTILLALAMMVVGFGAFRQREEL
jgi:hypothetical protein